jgi:hypothetical protein
MKKFIFCFDIDETLCKTYATNYIEAIPIESRIKKVNALFKEGHLIKIFTARGSDTGIDWSELTKNQLKNWKVNYTELIFGKPSADFYIDDKAIKDIDFDWN